MSKLRSPITAQIVSFEDADRSRRALEESVRELQDLPASSTRIIAGVELADGVERPIAHKLGRAPLFVRSSDPRGAVSTGRIEEIRGGYDRSQFVALKATGWGATITVDVEVK